MKNCCEVCCCICYCCCPWFLDRQLIEHRVQSISCQKSGSPRIEDGSMRQVNKDLQYQWGTINRNQLFLLSNCSDMANTLKMGLRQLQELTDIFSRREDDSMTSTSKSRRQGALIKKYGYIFLKSLKNQQIDNQFLIHQVGRIQSRKIKYTLNFPSMMKVTLLGINEIDKNNQCASISIKIELKVLISGLQDNLDAYLKIFKQLKLNLRNQDRNRSYNVMIDFKASQKIYHQYMWVNAQKYYDEIYYTEPHHNMEKHPFSSNIFGQFEGLIFSAQVDKLNCQINVDDLFAPFTLLDLTGMIEILPITTFLHDWEQPLKNTDSEIYNVKDQIQPQITLNFNLVDMNRQKAADVYLNQISAEKILIDSYEVANRFLLMQLDNKPRNSSVLRHKINYSYWLTRQNGQRKFDQSFNYAHYHFPIFHYPYASLATIFIPLFVLGILNLMIFFQDGNLAARVSNVSIVLIAFVGMIPIIHRQIKSQTCSIAAILVYLMILTPMLCLFDTFIMVFAEPYHKKLDVPLFYICMFFTGLNFVFPIIMLIIFKFNLVPQYKGFDHNNRVYNQNSAPKMPGSNHLNISRNQHLKKIKKQLIQNGQSANFLLKSRIQAEINAKLNIQEDFSALVRKINKFTQLKKPKIAQIIQPLLRKKDRLQTPQFQRELIHESLRYMHSPPH